jgi:signal transduction histidine kinase
VPSFSAGGDNGILAEIRATRDAAEGALRDLKTAQANLIQAEKMASLGQLTAGIAHEIKNRLNFVNNFAALSVDLLGELKESAVCRRHLSRRARHRGLGRRRIQLTRAPLPKNGQSQAWPWSI